ncbi:MAG: T9SS type A sorting domain-containing protein [Rhodothermales bacterium]|nr:T9SS type A sorting domain-containing protein [Rhodothermales bacterium]MBO6780153.1 T9SS type A sorting domain-containing protein [Rhodothermales bacterium]
MLRRLCQATVFFLLCVPSAASGQACDIFVNASDGDDGNPGSRVAPLRSFELAYRNAPAGGRVCVSAGEYFVGDDADGISLDIPGKSVTFQLDAFAGATEVRFSEKFVRFASGSGTLDFEPGSASALVFGAGVANTDNPTAPELENALHSVYFDASIVDFTGLTVTLGASVGVPGRVNPANSSKVAPDSARVRFQGNTLTGSIQYTPAPRVVEFGGGQQYRLPTDLSDHRLLFSGDVIVAESIDLPRGSIEFVRSGEVLFQDRVTITNSDSPIRSTADFAGLANMPEVHIAGAFPPPAAILHRGGTLFIGALRLGEGAAPATSRIENAGDLTIRDIASGQPWKADIVNLTGSLLFGPGGSQPLQFDGALSNAQVARLSSVHFAGTDLPTALNNTGALLHNGLTLADASDTYLNSGTISSASAPLVLGDGVSLSGGGATSTTELRAGSRLDAAEATALLVTGDASLTGSQLAITDSLVVDAAVTLDASTTALDVRGLVRVDGTLSGTDTLLVGGHLLGSGSATGFTLLRLDGGLRQSVSGLASWPSLELAGAGIDAPEGLTVSGQTSVTAGEHVVGTELRTGDLLVSGGTLQLESAASLDAASHITLVSGRLVGSGGTVIRFGGDLLGDGAVWQIPDAVLVASPGATRRLGLSGGIMAESLSLTGASVTLTQPLELIETLTLPATSSLTLESTLTLYANLLSEGGTLDWLGAGDLVWSGTSRISGLSTLPPSIVRGALEFTEDVSVSGLLNQEATGRLTIPAGTALTVQGITRLHGEVTVLGSLDLTGAADLADASLSMESGTLVLSGAGQALVLPPQVVGANLIARGAQVSINSDSVLRLLGTADISGVLELGSARIQHAGAWMSVTGTYAGSISVTDQAALDFGLRGNGVYGDLTLSMGDESRDVVLESPALNLAGTLNLETGGINLNGGALQFVGNAAGLALNVSDEAPGNGTPDGVRIAGGTVNAAGTPFDLSWSGDVTSLYTPGTELTWGPIRDLSVDLSDAANDPAVFGLSLGAPIEISGALSVTTGALVRLESGASLRSTGAHAHFLGGRTEGNGEIRLVGATSVQCDADGRVERLVLEDGAGTLLELAHVSNLTITGGSVTLGSSGRPGGLLIEESVVATDAAIAIADRVELAAGASLTGTASNWTIGTDHALYARAGASLTTDAASIWQLGAGTTPPEIIDGGFVVLTGDATLGLASPLPRLRVAPESETASDDVVLATDLVITDELVVVDGDIFMDRFSVTLDGASALLDADGEALDGDADAFFGDFAGTGGDLILKGPSNIQLGNSVEVSSANLRVRSNQDTDVVRIRSVNGPHEVVVTNKQFSLERGVLDIGLNDIVLEGSTADVFLSSGGRLVGTSAPQLPALAAHLGDAALFPLNDDHFGELVLGAGNATVALSASVTLDNVRLRGNLRLPNNGRTLTVANRLAAGRGGSQFLAAADGQLQIGAGAMIVMQGRGGLAGRPEFLGAYEVHYDLHDGSISGRASGAVAGSFSPGVEITAGFGELRRLSVLASPGIQFRNITALRITDALIVWAGTADFGGAITASGSVISASLDATSRAVLRTGGGYATSSPINLLLSAPFGDLTLAPDLFPAGASVDSLAVRAGSGAASRILMAGDRSVGAATISLHGADDSFNLNGAMLTTERSLELLGAGMVTSGPLAQLSSGEAFTLAAEASVGGSVALESGGLANLAGVFSGLSVTAGSDLIVDGDLGSSTSLFFTGADQSLELNAGPEAVAALSMSQDSDDGVVRLSGADLSVTGSVVLERGVFDTGSRTLRLPSSPGGIARGPGATSFIRGAASTTLPAGFSGSYPFHLGGAVYRPLTLGLTGLLTQSTFRTELSEDPVQSALGLPGFTGAVDLAPFTWRVTSSVNFVASQPYTVTVSVPESDLNGSASGVLLRQERLLTPQTRAATGTVADGRLTAESFSLSGGLSQTGSMFSIGLSELQGRTNTALQVVNADMRLGGGDTEFDVSGFPAAKLRRMQATASAAVYPGDRSAFEASTAQSSVGVPLTDERLTVLVSAIGERLIAVPDVRAEALFPARIQPWVVNASADAADVEFEINGDRTSVEAFSGAVPGAFLAGVVDVVVRDGSGAPIVAHRYDQTPLAGSTVGYVLTGSASSQTPGFGLQIWAVHPDGRIDLGEVTTSSDPGSELPERFLLHGNYPNPFNPVTQFVFDLPYAADVRIEVFDLTGRRVALLSESLQAGEQHTIQFDGARLPSAVYLYRATAQGAARSESATGRMVLLK